MEKSLTINQIVRLFIQSEEKGKQKTFEEVIIDLCKDAKIRNWEQFKKSNRSVFYQSRNLDQIIVIKGDNCHDKEGWSASELEYAFKQKLSKSTLVKINTVKQMFSGSIIV